METGTIFALLAIVGIPLVLVMLFIVYASRYKKVGPNEVLIISGRGAEAIDAATGQKARRSFRIVKGGGTFIWPVIERVDNLSLELMTMPWFGLTALKLEVIRVTVIRSWSILATQ